MNKEVLLAWDKPLILTEWEREKGKDEPARSGLLILGISLFLHALALFAVYNWETERFAFLAFALVISSLLMPIYHYIGMRSMCLKTERHYEFRGDGILYSYYNGKILYRWKRVLSYKIEQNSEIPKLKNLIVVSGLKWSPARCELIFDPAEVPEENIRAILEGKMRL